MTSILDVKLEFILHLKYGDFLQESYNDSSERNENTDNNTCSIITYT